MKKLKALQQDMMAYLQGEQANAVLDDITPNPSLSGHPLNIYKSSIIGNHLAAFTEIYPVIEQLVGRSFFNFAFEQFRKKVPNQSFDISLYGENFADFLRDFESCAQLKYLPDVARLEWFCHKACLGKSYMPIDLKALEKVPEVQLGQLRFKLPTDSFLIESDYPILRIWEVNQADFKGSQEVNLDDGGQKLFIWRKGLDLRIDKLDDIDFLALTSMKNGQTLEKMFYVLNKETKFKEQQCQTILSKMIQRGWLVGFNVLK